MKNKIIKYEIKLTTDQEKKIFEYLNELKELIKKENIDNEVFEDIENSLLEKLIIKKGKITDKYIDEIIDELWEAQEIVEPFKIERTSIKDELKTLFPLGKDKKDLLKYCAILLCKISWWIWISLWVISFLSVIPLFFVHINLFNVDITGSIPDFIKWFVLLISLLTIFVSSYCINFKNSKLRNYLTLGLFAVSFLIIIVGWYFFVHNYSKLNTYQYTVSANLKTWVNYSIWWINLFWWLTWNIYLTSIEKDLSKEYLQEGYGKISYISWNKIKIYITRDILGSLYQTDKFNQNISKLKITIKDNKIYIYRDWLYFKQKTILLPFIPYIKVKIPHNVVLKKQLDDKHKKDKKKKH